MIRSLPLPDMSRIWKRIQPAIALLICFFYITLAWGLILTLATGYFHLLTSFIVGDGHPFLFDWNLLRNALESWAYFFVICCIGGALIVARWLLLRLFKGYNPIYPVHRYVKSSQGFRTEPSSSFNTFMFELLPSLLLPRYSALLLL